MIVDIKGIKLFYRHFFYGSALTIGSIIGCFINPPMSWLHIALLTAGVILMIISGMITYAVNKYPEDFKDLL